MVQKKHIIIFALLLAVGPKVSNSLKTDNTNTDKEDDAWEQIDTQSKGSSQPSEEIEQQTYANSEVRISYCTSCSMKGAFTQVKDYVEKEFSGTQVSGETYPIAGYKVILGRAVLVAQMALAGFIMACEPIVKALGLQPEKYQGFVTTVKAKKFPILLASWFVGNMAQNALSATGAFEVFSGGEQIYSKLETGKMPTLEELYDGFSRTLQPSS